MRYRKLLLIALLVLILATSCYSNSIPSSSKSSIEICQDKPFLSVGNTSNPPEFDICHEISLLGEHLQHSKTHSTELTKVLVTDISKKQDFEYPIFQILVSANAYWYSSDNKTSLPDVEKVAQIFENTIYPNMVQRFGTPWVSSRNTNDKLRIIHVPLGSGIAGYFKPTDMYPTSIYPSSNEITAIYLHSDLQIGSDAYLAVLAHELQHAMHWNQDPTEETWFNEGLSELALNDFEYKPFNLNSFNPEISLIHWPYNNQSQNYLSARLFFTYLQEQYLQNDNLLYGLTKNSKDGIASINEYLPEIGITKSFEDIFGDWAIYNLLNGNSSKYNYSNLSGDTFDYAKQNSIGFGQKIHREIQQFSTQYVDIAVPKGNGDLTIMFDGASTVNSPFSPIDTPNKTCLWGNRGDSINTTLSTALNLSEMNSPTLELRTSYNIEDGWDYVHLLVSENNGTTWTALNARNMEPAPYSMKHLSYGYTGSKSWSNTSIDLSKYGSKEILLKLSYITDASTTGPGICVGDSIVKDTNQEINIKWQNNGFITISDYIEQKFIVNVVLMGQESKIIPITLDNANKGELTLPIPKYGSWYVVAISALNENSSIAAQYEVSTDKSQHR